MIWCRCIEGIATCLPKLLIFIYCIFYDALNLCTFDFMLKISFVEDITPKIYV